jgi:hypothetical protein
MPESFEDGVEKAVLTAHFWLARLFSKVVASSAPEHAKNVQRR